jgi:hypothetical protein
MDGFTSVVYAASLTSLGHACMFTPEEADGTIGFSCDVTDVICPAQIVANGYT